MLSLVLALVMPGSAAELELRVSPRLGTRAVLAMATDGGPSVISACRDDGKAPDETADGIWSCGPLDLAAGSVAAAVAIDGRLVDVGEVVLPGSGLTLEVSHDGASTEVSSGRGALTRTPGAKGAPLLPTLVVRVEGDFSDGAPMLQVSGAHGSWQVSCRDDGNFPDGERNDGEQACAGAAPGPDVEIWLQGSGANPVDLGTFGVDLAAPAVALDLNTRTRKGAVGSLVPWPWPAVAPPDPVPPEPGPEAVPPEPGPDPVPPEPGPDPVPPVGEPEQGSPPQATAPTPPRSSSIGAAPQAHGGPASQTGRGLIDLLAVLGAVATGFGLAWVVLPRGPRLPPGVEVLDAPPIFDGGPRLSDRVALLRAADPQALTQELVRRLAGHRTVLVVLPDEVGLTPVPGAPVYRSRSLDWEDVAVQIQGLARLGGLPPAVVVMGRELLQAPGAVADDPPARLAEGLPQGSWLGVVGGEGDATIGFLVPWEASVVDGAWVVQPATGDTA